MVLWVSRAHSSSRELNFGFHFLFNSGVDGK